MNQSRTVRKNGLEAPFEPLQIATWFLLATMIAGFYGVIIPPLSIVLQALLGIIFAILVVIAVVAAFLACWIDPSDDNVLGLATVGVNNGGTDNIYCRFCATHVNRSSKHCRNCEKCVDEFDHHCKWLNNCIGKKNYRHFLVLLVATFAFTLLELAMFIHNVAVYFQDKDDYKTQVEDAYGASASPLGPLIASWIFIVALTPVAGLLGQLFFFHITLLREGLTTYDYIIREQTREHEARHQRRNNTQVNPNGTAASTDDKEEGLCCCSFSSASNGNKSATGKQNNNSKEIKLESKKKEEDLES